MFVISFFLDDFLLKVCDVTTGQTLNRGQCGEICVRGPTVMKGEFYCTVSQALKQ